MKILSVIETFAHGGAETVLVDLALGLNEHEHHVVHSSGANGVAPHRGFVDALEHAGVRCSEAHWGVFGQPEARRRALDGFAPDVVLCHWWGKDPWRPWLLESPRPHFVLVMHRAGIPAPSGYDRYVLVARSQQPQAPALPTTQVRVIPNGIDLARFDRVAALPRADSDIVIGRLSGLRDGKIPRDWIGRAARFDLPGARFVIAGDGPLRGELEAEVRSLGLQSRFSLPGYIPRERVPQLLAGFDIFCHVTGPALVECHPLALLESLAAGVPIVGEARGGVPEIVNHGENGLLAGSEAELGAHLQALSRDRALRLRLAAGARASAQGFGLERQLGAYRALLGEFAAREPSPVTWPASIVIPLLRQRDAWLRQALESALGQSLRAEVIVVTSCHTPASNLALLETARRGAGGRLVVAQRTGGGFANALNSGLALASAPRAGFLLSDDWLEPNAIEQCLALDADIVSTGVLRRDAQGQPIAHLHRPMSAVEFARRETLEQKASYLTHFFLFRAGAIAAAGGLDESLGDAPGIDDYDLIWTLLERGASVALADRPLYNHRVHDGERLTLRDAESQLRTLERIYDKHGLSGPQRERRLRENARWFGRPEDVVHAELLKKAPE